MPSRSIQELFEPRGSAAALSLIMSILAGGSFAISLVIYFHHNCEETDELAGCIIVRTGTSFWERISAKDRMNETFLCHSLVYFTLEGI
jgi:hypothetical protein